MSRYRWSLLNTQQVGAFTEYFVKMELTMYGFQVYTTEVDDRGIDFIARYRHGPYVQVQVKSLRSHGYTFMEKTKFELHEHTYLALGLLLEGQPPDLYLIPSSAWLVPEGLFVERNYEGLKSKPEWGIRLAKKHMPSLERFRFEATVEKLCRPTGVQTEP